MTCILLGLIAACGRGSSANRPDDAGLDVPVDACDHGACADAAPGDAPADTPGDAPAQIVARKSVAVIVDFANAQLEDWQGPGFNNLAEVATQLHAMEAHWEFLSRGRETMHWDIIRVQLPRPLTNTAYPDFNAFRDAAVLAAKQQLSVADYDANGDGIIDTMWLITSDNGTRPPYLVGGTSQNEGANNFGDGQDSDSVVGGATGNFNHEVGHTFGLPDIYGSYDSLQDLTVMSSSWPLPANDFTAFERIRLGWVTPQVITQSTAGLILPDAGTHLAAIKVPTGRPEEYFLLEYRKKPETGFGSAAGFDFDGIAVYHVFEASNQAVDPPLLKLEPADGTTATTLVPAPTDFAYPGNPAMRSPFVLRTYFGGDPVFQLDHLAWTADGAIAFDLTILSVGPGSAPNLVANSTFEPGTTGWIHGGYLPDAAVFDWAGIGANASQHSVSVSSSISNDVEWSTPLTGLTTGSSVFMCGFLRGENIAGGAGGSISISATFLQTAGLHGTFDFTRACAVVTAFATSFDVACRLGGFSSTTSGALWCDDVTVVPLTRVFAP
ncbi:MAG TPA: hypothetical protein VF713_05610 [Thermoanaerobaculia bacterium]